MFRWWYVEVYQTGGQCLVRRSRLVAGLLNCQQPAISHGLGSPKRYHGEGCPAQGRGCPMTAVAPHEGQVQMLTLSQIRRELAELTRRVEDKGCTLEEFKVRGENWELDAKERGLLAKIRGLEFLLRPRTR